MQIVVLDGYALNPGDLSWDGIKRFGTLSIYDRTPPDCTAERLNGADVAFTNKTRITAADLERAANLKYIGVLATGYDVLDLAAIRKQGIVATNVPGYGTDAVAQMTIALLLEVCNQVGHHSREVHKGRWMAAPDYCFWDYPLTELAGLTFGVLGTGSIGRATAKIAQAFNMRVLGTSPHEYPDFVGEYVPFDELLRRSDVLSLHCPAKADTMGIINADTIAKMKTGAVLLNTARGQLINAQDLADALTDGKLFAAAVDVAEREPISRNNPLLNTPNCIITPHIAWAPQATRVRLMRIAEENLEAFLNGTPIHRVD
ncbi:MAG: D-2-hydroxyacid dehydrogenase [Clostridia bacterium]